LIRLAAKARKVAARRPRTGCPHQPLTDATGKKTPSASRSDPSLGEDDGGGAIDATRSSQRKLSRGSVATSSDAVSQGLTALARILARNAARKWYLESQAVGDPTTEEE
jgi:hypothetical protein